MQPTPYDRLGGAEKVRELVDRFYDAMDALPQAHEVRQLHPQSLDGSRDKLFWFLSGWLGGPDLYIERVGHPRLRARHMPFSIGENERDQWLLCMDYALSAMNPEPLLKDSLMQSFWRTADFMRNRAGDAVPA